MAKTALQITKEDMAVYRIVEKLSPTWQQTKIELLAFNEFLDQLEMS